jgi:hypothetical protein
MGRGLGDGVMAAALIDRLVRHRHVANVRRTNYGKTGCARWRRVVSSS